MAVQVRRRDASALCKEIRLFQLKSRFAYWAPAPVKGLYVVARILQICYGMSGKPLTTTTTYNP